VKLRSDLQPGLDMELERGTESAQWDVAKRFVALTLLVLLPVTLGRQSYLPDSGRWGTSGSIVVFLIWSISFLDFALE
jgi:hypothetical protein